MYLPKSDAPKLLQGRTSAPGWWLRLSRRVKFFAGCHNFLYYLVITEIFRGSPLQTFSSHTLWLVGQLLCTHFCDILLWGLPNSTSFLQFYNITSYNPFSSFLLLLFLSRSDLPLKVGLEQRILFSIFSFYLSKHQCKKKKVNVRNCSFFLFLSIYPKQNWKCISILLSWFPGVPNPLFCKKPVWVPVLLRMKSWAMSQD